MFAAVHPRPLVSPSSRDLCGRRLPGLPRASREPGRDVSALDCSFSFTLSNLHLSTFNFQTCSNSFPYLVTSLLPSFLCLKSFICNTYGSPRKCCKQKTYAPAKPFRCNTYKKHGGGGAAVEFLKQNFNCMEIPTESRHPSGLQAAQRSLAISIRVLTSSSPITINCPLVGTFLTSLPHYV